MPSSSYHGGHASGSSSRHAEHDSFRSRPSRSDRSPDDRSRRPRSPESRSYSHRNDDWHRSPEFPREDHWRPERRSSGDWRNSDEYSHSCSGGSAYYTSSRDRYYPEHDHRDSHRRDLDRRRPEESSASSRRYRSPSYDYRDQRDHSERARRVEKDHYARRSGEVDRAYTNNDRRKDRSPARSERSHGDREEDRYRPREDDRTRRSRDDREKDAGRYSRGRSRTRSRSRDRSRATDARGDYRSSDHSRSTKHEERSDHRSGRSEEGQLLERKSHAEEPRSIRPDRDGPEPAVTGSRGEHRSQDSQQDSDRRRSAHSQLNASAARTDDLPPSNGSLREHSRSDRPLSNGVARHRSRSPTRKETIPRTQVSTSRPPSPHAPNGRATSDRTELGRPPLKKEAPIARSFGHVALPHELPREVRGKNYTATGQPKGDSRPEYKTAADKLLVDAHTADPRRAGKKTQHYREELRTAEFRWDANSVGNKPLPAPRNLVLTDLPPILQPHQILVHVRPHGRVATCNLEMDPRIGQSLGIFRVTFAHDFDERGKPLESAPANQPPQHAGKAAKAAWLTLKDYRIMGTRIQAFLDQDGEIGAQKVKEKIAENEAKLKRSMAATAAPAARVTGSPATPSAVKPSMPPPQIPRGPRAHTNAAPSPSYASSSPSARAPTDRHEHSTSRPARYSSSYEETRKPSSSDAYHRRYDADEPSRAHPSRDSDKHRRPSPPQARVEAHKYFKSTKERIMTTLRNAKNPYVFIPKPAGCDVDAADVYAELYDTPPMWVGEGGDAFYAAFKVLADANRCKFAHETLSIGSYILQVDARPAPIVVPKDAISPGIKATAAAPAVQSHKKLDTGLRPLSAEEKQKTEWTATELQEAVYRMLQQHLADGFIRDVKNRVVSKHVEAYLKPGGEGREILVKAMTTVPVVPLLVHERASSSLTAGGEDRLPSFRRRTVDAKPREKTLDADESASKLRRDRKESTKNREAAGKVKSRRVREVSSSDDEVEDISRDAKISARRDSRSKNRHRAASLVDLSDDEEDDMDDGASTQPDTASTPATVDLDEELSSKGKKSSKAKATAATKKKGATTARKGGKAEVTPSEADGETEHGSETATPETELPVKAVKAKTKAAKASAKAKPLPADPFEAGLVEDAEDCAYLRLALEHLRETGELPTEDTLPDEVALEAEAEEQAVAAGAIPKHFTGSARTEGYYRIPPEQKALHLPDRNKATEDVDTSQNAQVLQSARNNRADSRRLVLGIEQHKRETATDTDIFKFNQLRTRKKQLKFAKSPIHDWGLYAMEFIPAGDMVIEYVGEVVRQQVADEREKQYERQGNFSTYLFRVDDDLVVDATHKGNIARLMNHCCTPNCNAKILTLNGEKRIVLFAKSPIRAGEELTYDYKFQSSADDEEAIPCLCGSPGCRRFL